MYKIGGRTRSDLSHFEGVSAILPAIKAVRIVPDEDSDLPDGPCRGLWAGDEGTVNLVFMDGTEAEDFPIFPGLNQITCRQVKPGGTAEDLWAIY